MKVGGECSKLGDRGRPKWVDWGVDETLTEFIYSGIFVVIFGEGQE